MTSGQGRDKTPPNQREGILPAPREQPRHPLQTENRQRISTLTVFLWAWVDYASRAAKNSPLGCFCAVFCDSAAAVRIHPPSLREGYYKTETPVPGSDTGVLGGRGWIRTTEAEKQQIYSLSPLATREHAQILFTSVAGRLVYFIRLRAICQLLFSDFCSFSAETVGRVSSGSDVSGARNPARRQWLRRTWGRGQ